MIASMIVGENLAIEEKNDLQTYILVIKFD
jgi:hypothetical protein